MNNFVKFPLVLGIVGVICTAALSLVYEITKGEINAKKNAEAIALLSDIVPNLTNAESVADKYDAESMKEANIKNMYEVSDSTGVIAYGYLAEVSAYQPNLNFVVALDNKKEVIIGFNVVSHKETNSGSYGGPLLDSPDFAAQFKDLPFDKVSSDVDFVAGSTAKITLNAVKTGVENIIAFHKQAIFKQESDGIKLTSGEREKFGLAEGQVMVDKSEEFKTALKNNTTENAYNKTLESLALINYIEIQDAGGAVKGHAYAVEGKYNCEVEHGQRAWQDYKIGLMFDENEANTKLVIISSGDSLAAISKPSLDQMSWVSDNFNGKTVSELNDALSNTEIDAEAGSTFTTNAIKAHVATIINAHIRAFGN